MKHKAIKIDVETQSVTIIEVDDLKSYYDAIGNGCKLVQTVFQSENDDMLFCDEEGCLRPDDIKGGFLLECWKGIIVNNAIISGTDDEGESIDVKTTAEQIQSQVRWFNQAEAQIYATHVVNTPPLILKW
jgi:hypothetical protein